MSVTLPPDYKPSDDEEFMNPQQLEYFRQKLLRWKAELVREANETLSNLTEQNLQQPDMADRASLETEHSIELRTRDRDRKLISKIDAALRSGEHTSELQSLMRISYAVFCLKKKTVLCKQKNKNKNKTRTS